MNLSDGWTSMSAALKEMRTQWEAIRMDWNDGVSKDFEENHWEPLESQVVATLRAVDRLSPVLSRMQRDCS